MASRSEWFDAFLAYDLDKSYFNNVDAGDDTDDDDWWGSECDFYFVYKITKDYNFYNKI